MRIGVLAVQGAFIEHERMLEGLGAECVELRQRRDIEGLDGLVLPGGESTAQGRMLRELGMLEPLRQEIEQGLILLADRLANDPVRHFGTLPVTVRRNAYGRQLGSFETVAPVKGLGDFRMTFIRAPYVESAAEGVETLAVVDGKTVGVRFGNQIGLAFHPELGSDSRLHQMFLDLLTAPDD